MVFARSENQTLTDGEMLTTERHLAARAYSDLDVFAKSLNVKDFGDDSIDMELEMMLALVTIYRDWGPYLMSDLKSRHLDCVA